MVKKTLYVLLTLVLIMTCISFVYADHVITISDGSTYFSVNEDVFFTYNFSVNNTDADSVANITQVNITLATDVVFNDTNGTTTAATFDSVLGNLLWTNNSFLVMNKTIEYFWFNGTAYTPGTYNFTIRTINFTGFYDSNITLVVNDTTPPSTITSFNSTVINGSSIMWNWSNPGDADFNMSLIYLDGVNVLNTSNAYYNGTGLSCNTTYNLTINTADTTGNINTTDVTNINSTSLCFNQLDSCDNLTVPNTQYNLTQDVSSTGICIRVLNDSIVFDCKNYEISLTAGEGGAIDIASSLTNVTVRNCNITGGYTYGVDGLGADNVTVEDSEFHDTVNAAVYLRGSDSWVKVLRNRMFDCEYGVYLDTTVTGDVVEHNLVYNSSQSGMVIYDVTNSNISHNIINGSGTSGMSVIAVSNTDFINNTINNSGTIGISINGVSNSDFVNNTIFNSSQSGINLFSNSDNNRISGGEISYNNFGDDGSCGDDYSGVSFISGSDNNNLTGVNMHNNTCGAILIKANNNLIDGNNINDNCGQVRQIQIGGANDTTIQNNNITSGTGLGIQLLSGIFNTTIYNNVIETNANDGILSSVAGGADIYLNITGNTISGNGYSVNQRGIYISNAREVTIADNTFTNNTRAGLWADNSASILLLDNHFLNDSNGTGVFSSSSAFINWTIGSAVNCRNNNINITNGSITGHNNINHNNNCTVTVNGVGIIEPDTTAPTLTISSPVNSTYYTNQTITIDFTASDGSNLSSIWYGNDTGNTTTNTPNNASYNYVENINFTTTGNHLFVFYANDSVGNSVSEGINFSIIALPSNTTIASNQTSIEANDTTDQIVVAYNSSLQNVTINATYSDESIVFNFSQILSEGNITTTNEFLLVRQAATLNYTVAIPANTNISGGVNWSGDLALPIVNTTTFTAPSGSADIVITVGSDLNLNFSNPVKIVLGGMAGKSAAWSAGGTTLTNITAVCNSGNTTNTTAPTNISYATAPRLCYLDDGSDLNIWTYHFTIFAAYTPATAATEDTTTDGSSPGGTTPFWTSTYLADDDDFEEGFTREYAVKHRARVRIDSENHYIGVVEIDDSEVTINVSSEPQQVVLGPGEEAKFDVTDDDYYDILVSLDEVSDDKAKITIRSLVGLKQEVVEEIVEEKPEEEEDIIKEIETQMWWWIIGGIVIIILIGAGVGYGAKKKRRRLFGY